MNNKNPILYLFKVAENRFADTEWEEAIPQIKVGLVTQFAAWICLFLIPMWQFIVFQIFLIIFTYALYGFASWSYFNRTPKEKILKEMEQSHDNNNCWHAIHTRPSSHLIFIISVLILAIVFSTYMHQFINMDALASFDFSSLTITETIVTIILWVTFALFFISFFTTCTGPLIFLRKKFIEVHVKEGFQIKDEKFDTTKYTDYDGFIKIFYILAILTLIYFPMPPIFALSLAEAGSTSFMDLLTFIANGLGLYNSTSYWIIFFFRKFIIVVTFLYSAYLIKQVKEGKL